MKMCLLVYGQNKQYSHQMLHFVFIANVQSLNILNIDGEHDKC